LQNNRLIAYNILKGNITDNGFCTGCGACEATCPIGALQVKDEHVKRLVDCSQSLDLCPICYEMCPHSQSLLLRSLQAVSDAPFRSEAVGYFRRILLAQANDPKIREDSADGAVVTALLKYGVNNKVFDSAVVTKTDETNPIKPIPIVALTTEEITAAVGSKFFTSPTVKTYGSAVQEYGKQKIAVVGLPCQVLALRKIDSWKHKIGDKTRITLGLFCFGVFSLKPFLDYLEKEYDIAASDVKRMCLSRDLIVYTKQERIEIPISEAKKHITLGCKTCIDYTSEVADISIGSAYPMKEWSIVIIRTKKGEDFFNNAVHNGAINIRNIEKEPEVFEQLIVAALQKRTAGLITASKLEKKLTFVPVRLLREMDLLADVKIEEVMTKEVITVPSTMAVSELLTLMSTKNYIGYPVINEKQEFVGIVTMEEVTKVDKTARGKTKIGNIARQNIEVCYPFETALDAFRKMRQHETGRILIIDPANPKNLLGIVTKRDLMHALTKQASESVMQ
jgi:coenzyme F420 hydrogenase subunit beta